MMKFSSLRRFDKYLLFSAAFFVLFSIDHKYVTQRINLPQWIVLEMKTAEDVRLEVFTDVGQGYGEGYERMEVIRGGGDYQKIRIQVPGKPLKTFRIDPLTRPGVIYLKSISLESWFGRKSVWPAEKIVRDFHSQNDIAQFQLEGDVVKIESVGIDPYFGLNGLSPVINKIPKPWMILLLFGFFLFCLLIYNMAVLIQRRRRMEKPFWRPGVHPAFLVAGVLLPILIVLVLIRENGVNIPFYDEWAFVPLLKAYMEGKPWVHLLFEFHNEHRIVFPRMIFLASALITRWNVVTNMYVSLFFACILLLLVWLLLRETRAPRSMVVPVAWVLFSLAQYENFIWGWQVAIFLMSGALLASILFLTKVNRNGWYTVVAILSGLVATFSFANGLFIWPLGFVQLRMAKAGKALSFLWAGFGLLTIGLYFSGPFRYIDSPSGPNLFVFLKSPFEWARFFFAYIGASLSGGNVKQSIIYGSVVFLLFVLSASYSLFHPKLRENAVPWILIGLFSILSGALIAGARLDFGIESALLSKYTSISLLFILSALLLTFGFLWEVCAKMKGLPGQTVLTTFVVVALICTLGFVDGSVVGWREARYRKLILEQFSRPLFDAELRDTRGLHLIYWNVDKLKERATVLKDLRIGPYANSR